MGIPSDHPWLLKIQSAAAENCFGDVTCVKHTRLLMLSQLTGTYPIVALASSLLPDLVTRHPFLEAMAITVVIAMLVMLALALLTYATGLLRCPPSLRCRRPTTCGP